MRYKLIIEYDGSSYCGLQKQIDISRKSIAEVLELAVFKLTQTEVKIIASGRTDAGVHALGQVIHFDLNKNFDCHKIVMGLNNYLRGEAVAVLDCEIVAENFHARFEAKMRHYLYRIVNRRAPLILQKNRAWHVAQKLDAEAMREGAKFLIGNHDFSSFRDAECQASSPIRTISKIEIRQEGEEILIEVSAKSFLHHLVRNMVGTLVWVGLGKMKAMEVREILAAKNRTKSGPNAPACGLYFLRADYPKNHSNLEQIGDEQQQGN
jgi:tRNA pseudouridine38-40 synthase